MDHDLWCLGARRCEWNRDTGVAPRWITTLSTNTRVARVVDKVVIQRTLLSLISSYWSAPYYNIPTDAPVTGSDMQLNRSCWVGGGKQVIKTVRHPPEVLQITGGPYCKPARV